MSAGEAAAPPFAPWVEAGGIVATAGIVALEPGTLRPVCDDVEGQARWVLTELDELLADAEAEGAPLRLLRVECFLSDRAWFAAWNAAFADHFGPSAPARTTLVSELVLDGLLIEVQALAARDAGARPAATD